MIKAKTTIPNGCHFQIQGKLKRQKAMYAVKGKKWYYKEAKTYK